MPTGGAGRAVAVEGSDYRVGEALGLGHGRACEEEEEEEEVVEEEEKWAGSSS